MFSKIYYNWVLSQDNFT